MDILFGRTGMKRWNLLIWLILFGAAWGIFEAYLGEVLDSTSGKYSSVWLAMGAFIMLAAARAIVNKPGSSFAIGGIAALLRLANADPFVCHLLGILLLGLAFDITATLLFNREKRVYLSAVLSALGAVYLSNTLFALANTYIVGHQRWVDGGLSRIADHILVAGSLAALGALLAAPLGCWIGRRARRLANERPQWVYSAATAAALILWAVGLLAGR